MWIAVDLDDTLLDRHNKARPGAREAMEQLLKEGHRITIWTARFARAKEPDVKDLVLEIVGQLQAEGIPCTDIWIEHYKPQADLFIGDNLVPYAGDWAQTLAQAHLTMKIRGPVQKVPEYEEG